MIADPPSAPNVAETVSDLSPAVILLIVGAVGIVLDGDADNTMSKNTPLSVDQVDPPSVDRSAENVGAGVISVEGDVAEYFQPNVPPLEPVATR